MLEVKENYKLINLNIDGNVRTLPINTSEAWNVFECESKHGLIKVNEGDVISFITENGEMKKGTVTKITGKKGNTKIQIKPQGMEYEEIWAVVDIKENSLFIAEDTQDNDDEE